MDIITAPRIFEKYPDVLCVEELCEMLGGISKKLAYRLLKQNAIPSIRIGREYKIAKLAVADFIMQRENHKPSEASDKTIDEKSETTQTIEQANETSE